MPASLELGAGEPTTLKPTTPVEVGLTFDSSGIRTFVTARADTDSS
jgi:hypothetical protein